MQSFILYNAECRYNAEYKNLRAKNSWQIVYLYKLLGKSAFYCVVYMQIVQILYLQDTPPICYYY